MSVEQYSLVAHDWLNLEFIINDLAIRVIGQELGTGSSPTWAGATLTGLTASSLVAADANKALESVTIGSSLSYSRPTLNTIQGIRTVDSPTFADLTLSAPSNIYALSHDSFADVHQDVNTTASPQFAGMAMTGILNASAGEILVEDNDTSEPSSETDGYVGVAYISSEGRIYFAVNGTTYYISGTEVAAAAIATGNPIGLLLSLTYDIP